MNHSPFPTLNSHIRYKPSALWNEAEVELPTFLWSWLEASHSGAMTLAQMAKAWRVPIEEAELLSGWLEESSVLEVVPVETFAYRDWLSIQSAPQSEGSQEVDTLEVLEVEPLEAELSAPTKSDTKFTVVDRGTKASASASSNVVQCEVF